MSEHAQDGHLSYTEQSPLLPDERDLRVHRKSSNRWCSKITPVTLIIPVAILLRLASTLPSTTTFFVVGQAVCRTWYAINDPSSIPPTGNMPDGLCSHPDVEKYYSATLTGLSIVDGVGCLVSLSMIGYLASRIGRKPTMLISITIGLMANVFMICSRYADGWMEVILLVCWSICSAMAAPPIIVFLVNTFVIDLVDPEKRTPTLSRMTGWGTIGSALSFTAGGLITTRSGDALRVYLVAAVIWTTMLVYTGLLIPESFPKDKRAERQRQRLAHLPQPDQVPTQRAIMGKLCSILAIPLDPLKQLKPTLNPLTGRLNWRLVYCGIHIFFAEAAGAYAVIAMVLFLTTRFSYTPVDTGYVLTALNLTNVVVLTFVVPTAICVLRPLYKRIQHVEVEVPDTSSHDSGVTPATDHLDVHITFASWVIEAAAYLLVGAATTRFTQLGAVMLVGFGAGRAPVFRSLVVSSVDPLKQGEALAAIEMISSCGMLLSPMVMGGILTSTISTFPQLVFYVHAVIVISAASVLFLVRDVDRYQKQCDD